MADARLILLIDELTRLERHGSWLLNHAVEIDKSWEHLDWDNMSVEAATGAGDLRTRWHGNGWRIL